MILLIHSTGGASHVGIYVFKFHYDSINSMSSVDLSHPDAHLNSIMILLIQYIYSLLTPPLSSFKFHYDSINSKKRFSYSASFKVI